MRHLPEVGSTWRVNKIRTLGLTATPYTVTEILEVDGETLIRFNGPSLMDYKYSVKDFNRTFGTDFSAKPTTADWSEVERTLREFNAARIELRRLEAVSARKWNEADAARLENEAYRKVLSKAGQEYNDALQDVEDSIGNP